MEEQEKREETKTEPETKECQCNSCQVQRLIKGLCEVRLKYGPIF